MSIQQIFMINPDFESVTIKSAAPLYHQIKQWIINQIRKGQFKPGMRIPGEFELMRILNVSRGTIREALRELTNEGILYGVRGHGTYVKEMEKSSWAVNTFLSVAESFDHTDTDYSTRILEIGCNEAETDIAAQLQVAPRTKVVYIHRLRLIKDEPVHLSTSYLPFTIAASLLETDLNNTSLYRAMEEKLGLKVTRVDRRVFARLADTWETEHLRLPEISAIMVLKGTAFSVIEKPVEYSIARFPTDRSQFIIQSRTLA